jgi:ribose transport system permease protein
MRSSTGRAIARSGLGRLFGLSRPSVVPFGDQAGIVLALVLIMVILTVFQPTYFLTRDNQTNVARQISVNALLALGQFLVILTAGIDLSVGSVMALSMVSLAILTHTGTPAVPAMFLALVIGLACGLINGWALTKLHLPHPFISTLAMLNIARGATNLVTGGVPVSGVPWPVRLFGAGNLRLFQWQGEWVVIPVSLIVVLLLYAAFGVFLTRTRTGRHIYAVGGNPQAALYAGINVNRVLTLVYVLSGGLAGVAAILLAGRTNSGFPNAGVGAELDAIAAVIIGGASFFGGRGGVVGTLVGVLIMGYIRNGLNLLNVSVFWQQVAIGLIILIAVYVDVLRRRPGRV